MRSFDVSVSCGQPALKSLPGVVKDLITQGYAILDHKRTMATLVYSRGSPRAPRLDQARHQLEVKVDGEALAFHFYAMAPQGQPPLRSAERQQLEARARRAVESIAAAPRVAAAPRGKKSAARGTRSFEVIVPCELPATQALANAMAQLATAGYRKVEQDRTRAVMAFGNAMDIGSRFDKRRHDVEITAEAAQLRLRFSTDRDDTNEIVTKRERDALTERAQQAARPAALAEPPARPPADATDDFRCRYCKQLTPLSLPQCRQCGADNFL